MPNEVGVRVTGRDDGAGRVLDSASSGMKAVGRDAIKASAEVKLLDHEIKQAERSIRDLGRAWTNDALGTGTNQGSILNALKKQRSELAELSRIRKEIFSGDDKKPGGSFLGIATMLGKEGAEGASTFASAFQGGIMNAFKSLPPEAQAAVLAGLGATLAAAAPAIAATVSLAVLGGVGAGGLIGGIVLASSDERVKDAFSDLADTAVKEGQSAAAVFVDPLVSSAGKFKDALLGPSIMPALQRGFSALSNTVEPLTDKLVEAAEEAMPGFEHALEAAEPLVMAIADELPRVGAALSSFFDSVADGSPGAIAAFKEIMRWVEGGIIVLGEWLQWASEVYAGMAKLGDAVEFLVTGEDHMESFGNVIQETGDQAAESAVQVQGLGEAFDSLFDRFMTSDQATLRLHEQWTRLNEELRKGTRTLNENTEAGQANVGAILQYLDVARAKYEADIRNNVSVDQATNSYNANVTALRNQLFQLGYNKEQVDALTAKYLQVPGEVRTDIVLEGAGQAAAYLGSLASAIAAIPRSVVIDTGIGRRHASGGITGAGWSIMNEYRPEPVRLPTGSMVYPSMAQGLASTPGAGPSATPTALRVEIAFSGAVDTYQATSFQKMLDAGLVTINVKHVEGAARAA